MTTSPPPLPPSPFKFGRKSPSFFTKQSSLLLRDPENQSLWPSDDNLPTVTEAELDGWYSYSFASEPFGVVVLALFAPLILQEVAVSQAFQLDKLTPCAKNSTNCILPIGGFWIDTSALPLFINSLCVLCQALLFISLSSLADHGYWRKSFLLLFAFLGATVSISYFFVDSLATISLVTLVSGICYGASFVFYYAFLPQLTRYHPSRLAAVELSGGREDAEMVIKVEERVGNGISSYGMAYGYAAGVGVLFICAWLVRQLGQTVFSMRLSCGIAGVWWLCFTLITWKRLPSRPGPPLPLGENYLWYSWKQTISTISSLKELSQILRFLLAWFFLSDGLTTLVTLSVMYGKAELNMPEAEIALAALVTPFAAFAGTHIWLKLQREFKLTTRDTVLLLSSLYCLIPAYALMGFVAPIGLNQTWEVWVVSVYNGFLLGAIQSYARVMFAELLPPGKEAQFFGLYSLTGRGSAWIGPLVTATLADWTHELRWGYGYILIELALTVWLISGVSTHVGRREVRNWQSRDHQLLVSLENL